LPATTQLEHRDIVKPYGHYYLVYNEPAIAPLGEAKPNWEVFRLLAERMGFEDDCFGDTDEDIITQALAADYEPFEGITLDRLKRDGWARLNLPETFAPFAEGGYSTPSGKCEFYSESLERAGLDPVPGYIPPRESPDSAPELAARFPLQLLSPPANSFLNTSFSHLKSFIRAEREPFIQLNAEDAAARGIVDGEMVRVWNDRGSCELVARISDRVKPGVAVALSIWWNKLSPGRANVNQTVSQALTDIGAGATFFDNLVEVALLD
jgi:anaerobic selenocysteine-containing dehydrogenase